MAPVNVKIEEFRVRNWADEGLFYENLSETSKELVDNLAVAVLGGQGKAMVIGYAGVGKTYLIEQFVANIDHYMSKTPSRKTPTFIRLTGDNWSEIERTIGGFENYAKVLQDHYGKPITEFCFITEFPQIAEKVTATFSKIPVILEATIPTYRAMIHSEQHGASKIWSSWTQIDANDVILTKAELVTALYYSLLNEFFKDFGVEITKKEITALITYFLNNAEVLKDSEAGPPIKTVAPPGVWALPLRRYMGHKIYARERFQNKNGSFNVGKAIKSIFEDTVGDMLDTIEVSGNDGGTQFIIEGFPPGLEDAVMAALTNNQDNESPKEEKKKKEFTYSKMTTLEDRLKAEVIGQDKAVKKVAEGMMIPAAGLNDPSKPLRSFLFLGPTGVGKTKLALTLGASLGTEPMNIIRLDMSEYSHDHEVAKLFGSPPGYVGHEAGGALTNAVKEHPNSIVLLDEIEKAHPKVYDQFLQVLDAGRMTAGSGETIDFTGTVIIMTSNLGIKELSKRETGFSPLTHEGAYNARQEKASQIITKEVEKNFTPEFINRIDEKIVFNELDKEIIAKIILKEMEILAKRMESKVKIAPAEDDIIDWILNKSETFKYGAREIQRVIANEISTPMAKFILSNTGNTKATLVLDGEKIKVEGVANG